MGIWLKMNIFFALYIYIFNSVLSNLCVVSLRTFSKSTKVRCMYISKRHATFVIFAPTRGIVRGKARQTNSFVEQLNSIYLTNNPESFPGLRLGYRLVNLKLCISNFTGLYIFCVTSRAVLF